MELIVNNKTTQVIFNGNLYLARHRNISAQYLGTGLTYLEAIENMDNTIDKYKLSLKEKCYF